MTDPTDPQIREPDNALHDARDALFLAGAELLGELGDLLPGHGFDPGRMHRWPPRQPVAPAGWVDLPMVTRALEPTSGAEIVVATFPVMFVVDGDDQAQVQFQDMLLSRGWDLLNAVQLTNEEGRRRSGARVQTAGNADIDVGGPVLRGVVFSVQMRLLVRTLCPTRITTEQPTTT